MTDRNEKRRLDSGAPGTGHQQTGVSVAAGGDDQLLDVAAAAAYINVKPSWVHSAVRAGTIPHLRLGRWVRLRRSSLDAWLAEIEQPARPVRLRSAAPRRSA